MWRKEMYYLMLYAQILDILVVADNLPSDANLAIRLEGLGDSNG